ncbi:MFS transporter [Streptomyces sp. O3]
MDFHMAGMDMGASMWWAMTGTVAGLVLAGLGLVPRREVTKAPDIPLEPPLEPPPDQRRGPLRRRLVAILSFALMVDQMKPATLAFILPGARAEYGLTRAEVALLPTTALAGTVVGSVLWGRLADRIGRRASVLLAALMFLATTVCGAMPTFGGNVLMCVLMGVSAGGMLPIVYALMSEVLPGRSGVMVLTAGLTTVGGYLAASGLASVFVPLYGWRSLWFLQLPFAVALLVLNRWIPESPSFLVSRGRGAEARRMARMFGLAEPPAAATPAAAPLSTAPLSTGALSIEALHTEALHTEALTADQPTRPGGRALFGSRHRRQTSLICGFALSWGLVYWGFVTFLPTVLTEAGLTTPAAQILLGASVLSIPGTAVTAWLYSRWSSRRTMVLYGAVTTLSLVALTTIPLDDATLAVPVLIGLLTGASGVVAVLGPYTAQVYPTALRGLGSGLSAACTKSGGILGPPAVGWLLAAMPLGGVAAAIAAPMALATAGVARYGTEVTRTRRPQDPPAPATARVPQPTGRAR